MASNANRAIKVEELKAGEAGRGAARLDPALMSILGLKSGDIVLVIGNKKTAVKVFPGDDSDANLGTVRIDGTTRRNAGVSIGDRVEVRKAESKEAEKITFSPIGELRLQGGEDYLAQALVGRAFAKGDVLSLNIMGNRIDLVVNMEPWEDGRAYDRLGLSTETCEILGVTLPMVTIPVRPGRNLAVIMELAAMNNRQKNMGYNAAETLAAEHDKNIDLGVGF